MKHRVSRRDILDALKESGIPIVGYKFGGSERGWTWLHLAIKHGNEVCPLVGRVRAHNIRFVSIEFERLSDYQRHNFVKSGYPDKLLKLLTPTTDTDELAWREMHAHGNAYMKETHRIAKAFEAKCRALGI